MKLPQQDPAEIKAALETDWSLHEKFETMSAAQQKTGKVKMSPQPTDN